MKNINIKVFESSDTIIDAVIRDGGGIKTDFKITIDKNDKIKVFKTATLDENLQKIIKEKYSEYKNDRYYDGLDKQEQIIRIFNKIQNLFEKKFDYATLDLTKMNSLYHIKIRETFLILKKQNLPVVSLLKKILQVIDDCVEEDVDTINMVYMFLCQDFTLFKDPHKENCVDEVDNILFAAKLLSELKEQLKIKMVTKIMAL